MLLSGNKSNYQIIKALEGANFLPVGANASQRLLPASASFASCSAPRAPRPRAALARARASQMCASRATSSRRSRTPPWCVSSPVVREPNPDTSNSPRQAAPMAMINSIWIVMRIASQTSPTCASLFCHIHRRRTFIGVSKYGSEPRCRETAAAASTGT